MEVLAWALNWPTAVKKLAFLPPDIPVLASFLLDRSASDPIAPPWPNLVLCAEARTSVIARQIRERAGDQVKIVCLGRPAGHPARFDLVPTNAQYRLPKSPQVVELDLPLSARDDTAPHHPVRNDIAALANAPRPLTVALIGGTAPPELLDGETATALARSLLSHVTNTRGTLVAITSPRTGEAARNAIVRMIREPHMVHLWREGADNSYGNLLALADEFVVTGDSVSMAAEALVTGKPVSVGACGPCCRMALRADLGKSEQVLMAQTARMATRYWANRTPARPKPSLRSPFRGGLFELVWRAVDRVAKDLSWKDDRRRYHAHRAAISSLIPQMTCSHAGVPQ
jgi:uncharacterized protein